MVLTVYCYYVKEKNLNESKEKAEPQPGLKIQDNKVRQRGMLLD